MHEEGGGAVLLRLIGFIEDCEDFDTSIAPPRVAGGRAGIRAPFQPLQHWVHAAILFEVLEIVAHLMIGDAIGAGSQEVVDIACNTI